MNDEKYIPDTALTSAKKVAEVHRKFAEAANPPALEQLRKTLSNPPKPLSDMYSDSGVFDAAPIYSPARITNEKLDHLIENAEQTAELTVLMKDAILELAEITRAANEKADQAQIENAKFNKRTFWIAFATLAATVVGVIVTFITSI